MFYSYSNSYAFFLSFLPLNTYIFSVSTPLPPPRFLPSFSIKCLVYTTLCWVCFITCSCGSGDELSHMDISAIAIAIAIATTPPHSTSLTHWLAILRTHALTRSMTSLKFIYSCPFVHLTWYANSRFLLPLLLLHLHPQTWETKNSVEFHKLYIVSIVSIVNIAYIVYKILPKKKGNENNKNNKKSVEGYKLPLDYLQLAFNSILFATNVSTFPIPPSPTSILFYIYLSLNLQ